jgi:hypothetical protein
MKIAVHMYNKSVPLKSCISTRTLLDLGEEVADIREPCIRMTDGREMTAKLVLAEEGDIGNSFGPVLRLTKC